MNATARNANDAEREHIAALIRESLLWPIEPKRPGKELNDHEPSTIDGPHLYDQPRSKRHP
jgi:hypothetical protein